MRVLVIEDETRLAATLQDLLELNGWTADVRHDGESGLDDALTGIYDVILLDVMLPRLDGFTVLRRLREAGNATPVLMLTARSEVADKVEGLDRGADYYLTKPFDPKELLACVRAWACGRRSCGTRTPWSLAACGWTRGASPSPAGRSPSASAGRSSTCASF